MDFDNKDEVILKETLRGSSIVGTVLNCILMFVLLVFVLAGIVLFIVSLRFPDVAGESATMLMGVLLFGGIFAYRAVGVIKGRVYAIISNEGITMRGSLLTDNQLGDVIPWENVREVKAVRVRKGVRVGIRYIGKDNAEHLAKIQHRQTSYSYNQVFKIVTEFKERNSKT